MLKGNSTVMDSEICSWVEVKISLFFLLFMPLRDDAPNRFSQVLLILLYEQYLFLFYSY